MSVWYAIGAVVYGLCGVVYLSSSMYAIRKSPAWAIALVFPLALLTSALWPIGVAVGVGIGFAKFGDDKWAA